MADAPHAERGELVDLGQRGLRRSRSPAEEESERRRKRKALSCYDCRRRKLKCDRQLPVCGRCLKGGHAETCIYESHVGDGHEDAGLSADEGDGRGIMRNGQVHHRVQPVAVAGLPTPPSAQDDTRTRLLLQEHRITELERRIALLERPQENSKPVFGLEQLAAAAKQAFTPGVTLSKHHRGQAKNLGDHESMIFHGKGFKTQFYGATQPSTLLFPELKTFMRESIKHQPSVSRVSDELRNLKDRWKMPKIVSFTTSRSERNLLDSLPDKKSADHLVDLYFSSYQKLFSIIHAPSFWKEYNDFWADPSTRRPEFLVILLLIIACVRCMSPREPSTFVGMSSTSREKALEMIEICQMWISDQSYKHSNLEVYQASCLLVLAKIVNAHKRKEMWTFAGSVIRRGVAHGYHRDPGLLGGPSPHNRSKKTAYFDQEMRRRIWTSIVELELITSLNRGMASATAGFSYDSAAPSNIRDDDLGLDMEEMPVPRSGAEFTSGSFLSACHNTLGLRTTLNALANNPSYKMTYEDAMMYTNKILEELDSLPAWTKQEDVGTELPRALLEIELRHFLILLHTPFGRDPKQTGQFSQSIMISHDAATRILELHSNLCAAGTYALALLRFDVYQAAICICYNTLMASQVQSGFLFRSMSTALNSLVDSALSVLEQQIMLMGEGYQNYWFACAASGLVMSKTSVTPEYAKQHATDRMIRLYYKILGSQDRPPPKPAGISHYHPTAMCPERPTQAGMDADPLRQPQDLAMPPPISTPSTHTGLADGSNGDAMPTMGFPELSDWDIASFWTFDAFNIPESHWTSPE